MSFISWCWNLIEIDTKLHDYSMSFMQILFGFHVKTWHVFCKSSNYGFSMAFAKKLIGFPSDLVSFSIKLPSKRHDKIRVTFFIGWVLIIINLSCSYSFRFSFIKRPWGLRTGINKSTTNFSSATFWEKKVKNEFVEYFLLRLCL